VLVVPVFVLLLAQSPDGSVVAAALFGVAAVSDALDGHLARSRAAITRFGTILDPLADKLLVGAALVTLVALDRLALWAALVIIGREAAVTGLRFVRNRRGVVIPASALGKAKMWTQVAAVTALIAAPDPSAAWVLALLYAAVTATVVSGADYFLSYYREVRRGRALGVRESRQRRSSGQRKSAAAAPLAPPRGRRGTLPSDARR
jgi:CDP-diacylglycerol--glycerol-3-phosphate 3-phosphatidyltransferase